MGLRQGTNPRHAAISALWPGVLICALFAAMWIAFLAGVESWGPNPADRPDLQPLPLVVVSKPAPCSVRINEPQLRDCTFVFEWKP